jgi:hypothetical protein
MNSLRKLLVITERGRVVGTQVVVDPPAGQPPVSAALRPGPGQKLHELEVEMPTRFTGAKEVEAFHTKISKQLQRKKQRPKKRR